MDVGGFFEKVKLIKLLKTNQEKAKAARVVLREVLENLFTDAFKKKNLSLIELIDSHIVKNYIKDDQIIESLHFIRIIGVTAEHGDDVRDRDVKIVIENLQHFLNYLDAKNNNRPIDTPLSFTEAQTRKAYIDLYLKEAGWEVLERKGAVIPGKAGIEIEVDNMPNPAGIGFCDYVLYDRAGKPLAIVEAKKTSVDPQVGRHQADLYAESMKLKYGYKPVIYYSNGYETYIIDGLYPDRKVVAFHTLDQLERMIQRRKRGALEDISVNENIAGRPYQKMAVTSVCERLSQKHRRGLVVMATGTGKTRTAIALTDILARNGWIKNVLFLADRTALVKQAKQNFADLLPNMSICELSDGNNAHKNLDARIMFSTYQTMIKYIDAEDKEFSTGRFDLIIVDEAHRSIFNRYGSIFAYFDSLLVGFTATPRDEVKNNTYSIFECESGEPTFDYSLENAIREHYLVGHKVFARSSSIMTEGVRKEDLDDEQLEILEDYFDGDLDTPDLRIPANAIFKTIFNETTCRKVLEDLMTNGLRVEEGETIGKTIIFAYNHHHAEMIVDQFRKMYPEHENTCQLVDYSVKYADSLIQEFNEKQDFRIAVSVDMLDTGVDIPAVLNLVFFKPVRSKIKFMQMIGRGTRLCEDVFGQGKDKECFYIFDYCDNFGYFKVDHEKVSISEKGMSLSQRLFAIRSEVVSCLQDYDSQNNSFLKEYYNKIVATLLGQVRKLQENKNRISVRQNLKYVDKYTTSRAWLSLTPVDIHELKTYVAPLIEGAEKDNFKVLAFDVRILRIQRAYLKNTPAIANEDIKKVRELARYLVDYQSAIPQVFEKHDDLVSLMDESTWISGNIERIEELRLSVRDLMQYLNIDSSKSIDIDVTDELIDVDIDVDDGFIDIRTYREKVIDYLSKNSNDETIEKIRNLRRLDINDVEKLKQLLWFDLGSEDDYNQNANGKSLAAFIRSLIGIDQEAVNELFSKYLGANRLNAKQQEFLDVIVKYVQKNGDIELSDLIENDPFRSIDWNELFNGDVEPIKYTVSSLHDAITVK